MNLKKDIAKLFGKDFLVNFDSKKESKKILAYPKIKEIIEKFNLNSEQITKGMSLLQRYYNYLVTNEDKEPDWKLTVDAYNNLQIDFSSNHFFLKKKQEDNFWLTNITKLENEWKLYFDTPNKKSPTRIHTEAKQALNYFDKNLIAEIKKVTSLKTKKGFFLVDSNFVNAQAIVKYLAFLLGTTKNKTVAFLDVNQFFNYTMNNYRNNKQDENELINKYLNQVDYLFLNNFGIGAKPELFITNLIATLNQREIDEKPTFITSLIDVTLNNVSIINSGNKTDRNLRINGVEKLLKNTISRIMTKFIAKNK
ncbi:hypothetical protein [Mycoplasma phocoeninasale]|uniref:hypothetical protein n=1 Tax=Mycoplasma phocoeninasale TaxID=2726117 RepID=UPI00196723B5|nr:hypothetical protein [Mycoplasma phocoeninasale]MBN0970428.1 hypothetical protein [Mycoplasma phocoeninasale]